MAVELNLQLARMETEGFEAQKIRAVASRRWQECTRDDANEIELASEPPAIADKDGASASTLSVRVYPAERKEREGAQIKNIRATHQDKG